MWKNLEDRRNRRCAKKPYREVECEGGEAGEDQKKEILQENRLRKEGIRRYVCGSRRGVVDNERIERIR